MSTIIQHDCAPRVSEITESCPGVDLLWGEPKASQVRQLLREATGRECIHEPGQDCPWVARGVKHLEHVAAKGKHEPWCTDHVDPDETVGPEGWCATATEVHGARLEIATHVDEIDGGVGIEFYAPTGTWMAPAHVVEVAAKAFEVEALAAGHGPATATVHRNLVRAIGSAGPLEVDALEAVGAALGIEVTGLFQQ